VKIQPLVKDPERLENRLAEIPPEPRVDLLRDGSDGIISIPHSAGKIIKYLWFAQRMQKHCQIEVYRVF
jgi:excinuclease ABC subunit C